MLLPLRLGIKPGIELSTGLCTSALAPGLSDALAGYHRRVISPRRFGLALRYPFGCQRQFPNRPERISKASSNNPGRRLEASTWLSTGSGAMSSVTGRPASAAASPASLR
jgi:hypothetical protein